LEGQCPSGILSVSGELALSDLHWGPLWLQGTGWQGEREKALPPSEGTERQESCQVGIDSGSHTSGVRGGLSQGSGQGRMAEGWLHVGDESVPWPLGWEGARVLRAGLGGP
jgi:hypothetical protein